MSRSATTSSSNRNAYERYKAWIGRQISVYGSKLPPLPKSKTELDVLKEHHKFIRDNATGQPTSWEDSVALRWYNKLFKEFALIDLKHYKTGQISLRWRTEDEVLDRTGELTCGNLRCQHHQASLEPPSPPTRRPLDHRADYIELEEDGEEERPLVPVNLTPYQLDFVYEEHGESLQALVKVILCDSCSRKLNYKSRKENVGDDSALVKSSEKVEEDVGKGSSRSDNRRHKERKRSRSPRPDDGGGRDRRSRNRSRSPRRTHRRDRKGLLHCNTSC